MLFGMIGIASSQDFSWGFNSSLGASRKFTGVYYNGQNFEEYGARAKNFSIGLNAQYRLLKRMSIGIEVNYYRNVFSRNESNVDFSAMYEYSYQWNGLTYYDYYYSNATAFFESSTTRSSTQPILLLDFNLTENLHVYGGMGLDVWSYSKSKFELKSVDRYGEDNNATPVYSDDQEFNNLQNNLNNSPYYSNLSTVYGFYYQMNNIKIGYRHYGVGLEKGLHQLTLGYDIGRYKYQ